MAKKNGVLLDALSFSGTQTNPVLGYLEVTTLPATVTTTADPVTVTISFTIKKSSIENFDPSAVGAAQAFLPFDDTPGELIISAASPPKLTLQQASLGAPVTATVTFVIEGGKLGGPGNIGAEAKTIRK